MENINSDERAIPIPEELSEHHILYLFKNFLYVRGAALALIKMTCHGKKCFFKKRTSFLFVN
jgi:hypothetical protein